MAGLLKAVEPESSRAGRPSNSQLNFWMGSQVLQFVVIQLRISPKGFISGEFSITLTSAGHGGGITGLSTDFLYQFHKQRLAIVFDTSQNAEDMEVDALIIMAG